MANHHINPEKLVGKKLGRYRITKMLGRGGMGAVYRAEPLEGGQAVAIKVLLIHPDSAQEQQTLERFQREVETHKNLDHPHIVKCHEAGEDQGIIYLVMSLMEGGSLHERINKNRQEGKYFTPEETVRYLRQICSALDYIHDQDIFHRDLKPANILLDVNGDTSLADFGIALQLGQTRFTQQGTVMATDLYASPEQWLGEEISGRSDIYALGCIAFEMLAGRTPFVSEKTGREQIPDLGQMHLKQPPPSVRAYNPELSHYIDKVVQKALAKAPDERFPSAGFFAEAFATAVSGQMPAGIDDDEGSFGSDTGEEARPTAPLSPGISISNPIRIPQPELPPTPVPHQDQRLVGALSGVILVLALIVVLLLLSFFGGGGDSELTPTPTATVTVTPPLDLSPTASWTATPTWTPSHTISPTPTETSTATASPTVFESPTPNQNTLIVMVLATATQHAVETAAVLAQTPSPSPIPPIPTETATTTPTPFFPVGADTRDWSSQERSLGGVEMVLVPAGCFTMGVDSGDKNEQPSHIVCLEKPFWIDKTEVSNGQFNTFGGSATRPSNWTDPDLPRETISWVEARDFCALRGARLPTEAEWEYAARGPQSLLYPWGSDWVADNAAYLETTTGQTESVNNRVEGASWVGALGMSGNVWEWVSSQYRSYPYDAADGREDMESGDQRVARGGSANANREMVRAVTRTRADPLLGYRFIGFRCARSME